MGERALFSHRQTHLFLPHSDVGKTFPRIGEAGFEVQTGHPSLHLFCEMPGQWISVPYSAAVFPLALQLPLAPRLKKLIWAEATGGPTKQTSWLGHGWGKVATYLKDQLSFRVVGAAAGFLALTPPFEGHLVSGEPPARWTPVLLLACMMQEERQLLALSWPLPRWCSVFETLCSQKQNSSFEVFSP